jgi:hypothetical protein
MHDGILATGAPSPTGLYLGSQGGELLLSPTGNPPGAMPLSDILNRTWHLLDEPGPDTNYPINTSGDYPQTTVTRDLNIALAEFIGLTGVAPDLSDVMRTLPVFAGLDYPVPSDLVALKQIEYTPNGQFPYKLVGQSDAEFYQTTGLILPPTAGQPYYYRQPNAGFIRLQPQPGAGNASGAPAGAISFSGYPLAGQIIAVHLVSNISSVVVSYTVLATDNLNTIALAVAQAINASSAVQGPQQFLSPAIVTQQSNPQTSPPAVPAGTSIVTAQASTYAVQASNYQVSVVLGGTANTSFSATPTTATAFSQTGDRMTWYYTSLGTVLVNLGDTPHLPAQFHMALVYRVLGDYWQRKKDSGQAKSYMEKYAELVKRAKAYTYDANRQNDGTMSGADDYLYPQSAIG